MTARETAERHAQDVVDGNLNGLMGDLVGTVLSDLVGSGAMPPNPTTAYEILSETSDGDAVRFRVRYSNDTEQLELETTGKQPDGGSWKFFKAEKVAA